MGKMGLYKKESLRGHVSSGPKEIIIEPTIFCNLNCAICWRKIAPVFLKSRNIRYPIKEGGFMPEEILDKILNYPMLPRISLAGFGEPMIHPDFLAIIYKIKRRGLECNVLTNGTLLNRRISKTLIELGLDRITFSIDGATAKTYKSIRNANLKSVLKNLENLNNMKKKNRSEYPKLSIAFVGMRRNIKEIVRMVKVGSKLGVRDMGVSHIITDPQSIGCVPLANFSYIELLKKESLYLYKDLANRYFDLALQEAKKYGMYLEVPYFTENNCSTDCRVFFEGLNISSDGKVTSCCFEKFLLGDLHSNTIGEIWNGKTARNLRKNYFLNGIEKMCYKCPRINQGTIIKTSF